MHDTHAHPKPVFANHARAGVATVFCLSLCTIINSGYAVAATIPFATPMRPTYHPVSSTRPMSLMLTVTHASNDDSTKLANFLKFRTDLALKWIKATPDQQQALHTILDTLAPQLVSEFEPGADAIHGLIAQYKQDAPDSAAIANYRDSLAEVTHAAVQSMIGGVIDMAGVLSGPQRRMLLDIMSRLQQGMMDKDKGNDDDGNHDDNNPHHMITALRENLKFRANLILDWVDGSPEQRQQVEQLIDRTLPEIALVGVFAKSLHERFMTELRQDTLDTATLGLLRDSAASLARAVVSRGVDITTDFANVLSGQQRRALIDIADHLHHDHPW